MNVSNPPIFDHIVGLGGGNWVPFEDVYAIGTITYTNTGVFVQTVAATRDYSVCKGLSACFNNNEATPQISFGLIGSDNITTYFEIIDIRPQFPVVRKLGYCSQYGGDRTDNTVTIKVSGWAPA